MAQDKKKEDSKKSNAANFKNAMCYVPFGAIVIFFAENKKTDVLRKNIKYWFIIFMAYVVLNFLLSWLMAWILFMVYIWISAFLWFKAYNWENVELDYIDDLEQKVKDKL